MMENYVFISGDLWKQYLKKKNSFFTCRDQWKKIICCWAQKKVLFSCVEARKKKNKNHVSRVSENTVFAAETSKKKYIYTL